MLQIKHEHDEHTALSIHWCSETFFYGASTHKPQCVKNCCERLKGFRLWLLQLHTARTYCELQRTACEGKAFWKGSYVSQQPIFIVLSEWLCHYFHAVCHDDEALEVCLSTTLSSFKKNHDNVSTRATAPLTGSLDQSFDGYMKTFSYPIIELGLKIFQSRFLGFARILRTKSKNGQRKKSW